MDPWVLKPVNEALYDFLKSTEVFLSFRGDDTRHGFTSHLNAALRRENIRTFIDDELFRGDEISPSLLKAIERSKISTVVFSEDYASSRWCLEELAHIHKCKKERGQIVIPVFYHVSPSDVRKQTGKFGEAFAKLEERFKGSPELVEEWRTALTEVANLSGWDSSVIRSESVLIQKIVSDVKRKLRYLSLRNIKELFGVESNIEKIELFLSAAARDVSTVGVCGVGGIGKSTLANILYSRISMQFESSCFIDNVGEQSEKSGGLTCLREQLLSALTLHDISSPDYGFNSIKKQSVRKKVLIIFDNVTHSGQIEFLIGGLRCFGPGSRIIVIARDKQVLEDCRVSKIHKVEGLPQDEALHLFCRYAFEENYPVDGYAELSRKIIGYAEGVPLVIRILGSFLYGKRPQDWETILNVLEKTPRMDIEKVLKICYDGLDDEEKRVFLDIACFLRGEHYDLALKTLKARHLSAETRVRALIDKSFVSLTDNAITMHDMLREMGREIFHQEIASSRIRRLHSRL